MILTGFLSLYLGQDFNFDLRNYHYYNGYSFLNLKIGQDFFGANLQTYLNPVFDSLAYLMIKYLPSKLTGFLIGAMQGINIYLLVLLTNFFIKPSNSSVDTFFIPGMIGLMGFISANVIGEIGTTFHDLTLAICALLSLLLMAHALKDDDLSSTKKWFLVMGAGLCLGMGAGFKLTLYPYCIGAAVAFIFLKKQWAIKLKMLILFFVGGLAGFTLINGYWTYLLWSNFGNPVFPFYNKIFKSEYYYPISFTNPWFYHKNILEAFFYPFYFSWNHLTSGVNISFRDFRMPCVEVLLIIYILKIIFKKKPISSINLHSLEFKKYFITFFISSYVIWQYQFSIQRYMMILDLLAPLMLYILLISIFNRELIIKSSLYSIFLFLIFTVKPIPWEKKSWSHSYFEVELPKGININQKAIVISPDKPLSFLRPFFPKDWHFIGVDIIGSDLFIDKFLRNISEIQTYQWFMLFNGKSKIYNIPKYGTPVADKTCYQIKSKAGNFYLCEFIPNKSLISFPGESNEIKYSSSTNN